MLYQRARMYLDYLPQQERIHAKQALDEMIGQAKNKKASCNDGKQNSYKHPKYSQEH